MSDMRLSGTPTVRETAPTQTPASNNPVSTNPQTPQASNTNPVTQ